MENLPTRLGVRETPVKYITEEEFQAIYDYALTLNRNRERTLLMLKMLWNLGCRISELLAIQVSDVDFKNNFVSVHVLKKRQLVNKTYKTYKRRNFVNRIPISPALSRDIENYIQLENLDSKGPLFDIGRTRAWKLITQITEVSIHRKVSPHAFRHGLAMTLLKNGVHPAVIQAILAHSSVNVTFNIYATVTDDMKRDALKKLEQK